MGVHVLIMQMRKLRLTKVKGLSIVPQLMWEARPGSEPGLCDSTTDAILSGIITASNTAQNLYPSLYTNLGDRHPVSWSLQLEGFLY